MDVNLNHLFVIHQKLNALMFDQGVLAFYLKSYKLHSIFSTPVLPSWRTFRIGMNWQQWYFGTMAASDHPIKFQWPYLPRFHGCGLCHRFRRESQPKPLTGSGVWHPFGMTWPTGLPASLMHRRVKNKEQGEFFWVTWTNYSRNHVPKLPNRSG